MPPRAILRPRGLKTPGERGEREGGKSEVGGEGEGEKRGGEKEGIMSQYQSKCSRKIQAIQ
jgi:hypothetical protein